MNRAAEIAKRRKWKRYKPTGGVLVLIRKPRFIEVGKPQMIEFGPLVDISMGGLAVNYVESKQRVVNSEELAITIASEGVKVERMPYTVVKDVEVATMPDGKKIRNRCVEFGILSDYQVFQLKSFIQAHTVEVRRDRRIGGNRRQSDDPRYEDEIYRNLYERRILDDRRNLSR